MTPPDDSGVSSGRGATDLLLLSPLANEAADEDGALAFCGIPEATEGWRGS